MPFKPKPIEEHCTNIIPLRFNEKTFLHLNDLAKTTNQKKAIFLRQFIENNLSQLEKLIYENI